MITDEHIKTFISQAHRCGDAKLMLCSSGNLSWRIGDKALISGTGSWVPTLSKEKVSICDIASGKPENGIKPSMESTFHLGVLRERPDVNVVLHTHQPKAVAVSLVTEEVPVISTTMVDELHDSVKVAPFTISSDKGMGVSTVEYAQKKGKAVILKQHGAIIYGTTLEQTLSSAVYLEETCEIYLSVLVTGKKIPVLSEEQIKLEDAPRGYYGQ